MENIRYEELPLVFRSTGSPEHDEIPEEAFEKIARENNGNV